MVGRPAVADVVVVVVDGDEGEGSAVGLVAMDPSYCLVFSLLVLRALREGGRGLHSRGRGPLGGGREVLRGAASVSKDDEGSSLVEVSGGGDCLVEAAGELPLGQRANLAFLCHGDCDGGEDDDGRDDDRDEAVVAGDAADAAADAAAGEQFAAAQSAAAGLQSAVAPAGAPQRAVQHRRLRLRHHHLCPVLLAILVRDRRDVHPFPRVQGGVDARADRARPRSARVLQRLRTRL